ncbi:MAG: pyridoxal phosphate-dependent aminotransferase [Paramuribaculum sp.]|nr:pyridoxal phosphate-dependent aminotransferase [Paramuribaculum sp.]
MTQISQRIQQMAASATLAMSARSAELREAGVDVINLSVGEPDFNTPHHIKEAAKQAIDDNYTFYTPVPGYMSLRRAIADYFNRLDSLSLDPAQIVVSTGAKQALCNVILATVNPGDEVIIPTPAWVSYMEMVKLAEGVPVTVPAAIEQDFKITPDQLRSAITPRTRMIMLCSPSNPSGSIYTRAELQSLVDVLADYPDILILSDEIYRHINYTGTYTSLATFPAVADRVVVINGVSKAYAMTGWRIGFMAGPLSVAKAVTKLQGQYTSGTSSIAQKAAEAAYTGPQECVEEMRVAFERRRNLVYHLACEIPGLKVREPQGAFYLFPEVSAYFGLHTPDGQTIADANDLAMYLLTDGHVATVSGDAFGLPGYLRLSYATSDDRLTEAFARIAAALSRLK